ncbi:MAG: arylsulfatase [Planctomycetota bacterium]
MSSPTRRAFLFAITSWLGLTTPTAGLAAEPPNILILYADDLGFGDLGCFNADSKIPTVHLDRLASQGIRFTDAHSSSGICTPSRYALLTGRYHWRDFHSIVNAFGDSVFDPNRVTMPEMLQSRGYHTAAIGKWHLGWDWNAIRHPDANAIGSGKRKAWPPEAFDWTKQIPDGPLAHGFDHYFGDTVINFPPYGWIEDDRMVRAPDRMMDTSVWKPIKEGNWECRPGPMVADWDPYENLPTTTQRGVDFIHEQAKSDEPFFLYFAFPCPHAPIIPNDEFDGASMAGPYGDLVVETDNACGRLLEALKETDQSANTLVIFSADNGPEKYAYARDESTGHWSAHPLRGLKRDLYEGGHHVPMIVRWPSMIQPGQVSDALVSQVDWMATLAGIVDFELPDDCAEDSHDLSPLLSGQSDQVRTHHIHNTRVDQYAIREGSWLMIDHRDGYVSTRNEPWERRHGYDADDGLPVELFDLSSDLGQRHNLASRFPQRIAHMKRELSRIRAQGHSAPRLSRDIESP